MRRNFWICVGLTLIFSTFLFITACQHQNVTSQPPVAPTVESNPQPTEETIKPEDTSARDAELEAQRLAEQRAREAREAAERAAQVAKAAFINEDLHFNFDDDALTATSQEILRKKAKWLRDNPNVSILIEGHCDERGTTEYNLALGDRRAESARSFLIDMGISASRMTKISYGEEMPIDPGHNEEAWRKNRRVHFTLE